MAAKIEFPNPNYWIERYISGVSVNKLSCEAGVSRSVIGRLLTENGVALRTQSESERVKWDRMSSEQRRRQVKAANIAVRGKTKTRGAKIRQALGKEKYLTNVSPVESVLADRLTGSFSTTQQKAIGFYNVDIAVNIPTVAVEIFGGGWHSYGRHKNRFAKRTKYILDSGWHMLIVWVDGRRYPLGETGISKIVSFVDEAGRLPSGIRQYGVILGNGDPAPVSDRYFNSRPIIEGFGSGVDRSGDYYLITR